MLYVRKLFTQDLRDGKQIAFPKEPSLSFFVFDYISKEDDRKISFTFKAAFDEFSEYDGKVITTRLYAAGSEARMDGEVKAFIRDELNAKVDDLLIFKSKGTKHTDFEVMFLPQSNSYYPMLLALTNGDNHSVCCFYDNNLNDLKKTSPLQRIFYGAPGTGKSYSVFSAIAIHSGIINKDEKLSDGQRKSLEKADNIFRTTFHPDYDYAQFVGCYKPRKDGDKITYDFVPQVFTKALIEAYGSHIEPVSSRSRGTSISNCLTFDCRGAKYTINAVSDRNITTTKEYCIKKSAVQSTWNILWDTGSYVVKTGPQSGRSTQIAVCNWINSNYNSPAANNFDDGWTYLVDALDAGPIIADSVFQKYQVSKVDSETLHITSQGNNAKSTLQGCYNGSSKCEGIQVGIIDILKKYNEDSFENAWEKLSQNVNSSYSEESEEDINIEQNVDSVSETQSTAPVYLVIEEINRGNCAQIFGDIFQLLDRNSEGESEYAINVDEDLKKYLEEKCPNAINNGKIKLPSNFNIIATMNTSDQSLFPMDSAFKRRWEWQYVPIDLSDKVDSSKFEITIDGSKYKWHDFLKAVNVKIKDVTKSEDKQMGNFFIKKSVDAKEFCNKVMFYLWNDISKDYYESNDSLFQYKTGDGTKHFSFNELFGTKQFELLKGFMSFVGCEVSNSAKPEETTVSEEPQKEEDNN